MKQKRSLMKSKGNWSFKDKKLTKKKGMFKKLKMNLHKRKPNSI